MITKILVGVDSSENSEKALDYALEVAEKFSASILILNVFQPLPDSKKNQLDMFQQSQTSVSQDLMNYQSNSASLSKEFRSLHEAVLSKAMERAAKLKPDLKITAELKEGEVSSQIIETASNGQFDLIVVGHKGESKIEEFFLGSTSENVVHRAKCTVLITK